MPVILVKSRHLKRCLLAGVLVLLIMILHQFNNGMEHSNSQQQYQCRSCNHKGSCSKYFHHVPPSYVFCSQGIHRKSRKGSSHFLHCTPLAHAYGSNSCVSVSVAGRQVLLLQLLQQFLLPPSKPFCLFLPWCKSSL